MDRLAPVGFSLTAEGLEKIQSTFKSLIDQTKGLNAALTQDTKQAAETRSRSRKKESDDHAKEEKKKTSELQKESKKREALQERQFAKLKRETDKWHRDEIQAEKRKNQQLEAEAQKAASTRERFASRVGGRVASTLGRVTGVAAGLAAGVATLGGGFGVVDAVSKTISDHGKAKQISLNSGGEVSKSQVLATAHSISQNEGFTSDQSLEAIDQFVAKTGNSKMALSTIKELSELANATGADLKDLASAAGLAFNADQTMDAEKLMKIMRQLAVQGRAGALDMRDMATSLARVTATAGQFKGDLFKNVNTLGAFAQLSMQAGTAVSAAEATESVATLPRDIAEHDKEFRAKGIVTKDKYGQLIDPETIVKDSVLKTHGDKTQLLKLFGARSYRGIEGYANTFQKERATALASGMKETDADNVATTKAMALLKKFTDAELSKAQVSKEAAERKEEADKKLIMVFEQMREAVGTKLVPKLLDLIPVIERLVPRLADLTEAFVRTVEFVENNPLKSVFIGMAAVVAGSLAKAFAAEAIQGIIAKGFGGSAVAGGVGTGLASAAISIGVLEVAAITSMLVANIGREVAAGAVKGTKDSEDLDIRETAAKQKLASATTIAGKQAATDELAQIDKERKDKVTNAQAVVDAGNGGTGDQALSMLNTLERAITLPLAEIWKNNPLTKALEEEHDGFSKAIKDRSEAEAILSREQELYAKDIAKWRQMLNNNPAGGTPSYGPPPPSTHGSPPTTDGNH
jgi:hypothetical protein